MRQIILFTAIQLVSIIVSTFKYVLTGNAKPWIATVINAISCAIGNLATIFLVKIDPMYGTIITLVDTLIGVPVARYIIDKCSKDRLFIFTATVRCVEDEAYRIREELKQTEIHSNWQEISKDKLYTFSIYSNSKNDSKIITNLLKDYNAKYHVLEAR